MDSQQAEGTQLLFIIFLSMGAIMLLIVYWMQARRKKLIEMGYNATGKVIDVLREAAGKAGGSWVYCPVIEFKTVMNETIIKKYPIGTNPSAYKIGDEIEIYYHPDNPSRFIIKKDKAMSLLFMILGSIGTIFLLVGLGGIIYLSW